MTPLYLVCVVLQVMFCNPVEGCLAYVCFGQFPDALQLYFVEFELFLVVLNSCIPVFTSSMSLVLMKI